MKNRFTTVLIFIVAVVIIWRVFNRGEGFENEVNPKYANKFQADASITSSRFLVTANPPTKTGK